MSLFLVQDPWIKVPSWLAWKDDYNIFVYVPNFHELVLHSPLTNDFYWEGDLNYDPISYDKALQVIADGDIGRLDPSLSHQKGLLDRLEAVQERRSVYCLLH